MPNSKPFCLAIFAIMAIALCTTACKSSEYQVNNKKMKLAKWPGLFLKEPLEWYMPDAIWTVNNSSSVNIKGQGSFRDRLANIVIKANLVSKDSSIWNLKFTIDGHEADSLEELEIWDKIAYATAKGIIQHESALIKNPPKLELSDEATSLMPFIARNCTEFATFPPLFKKLSIIEQSQKTIDLAECIINNTTNKEITEYYTSLIKNARWAIITSNEVKEISDYTNKFVLQDSVIMNFYNNTKKEQSAKDSSSLAAP